MPRWKLANECGVSESTVERWETGETKPEPDDVYNIQKALGIHPTQKPIDLYSWLLQKYAKPGYKIIDTHVGSASSLIACHRGGFGFIGFEIDPGYYEAAAERLDAEMAQVRFEFYESQIKMME